MAEEKSFRHLVRVANTDLDGNKQIGVAMTKVKGVGVSLANAVCKIAGIDLARKTGYLTEEESGKMDAILGDLENSPVPSWMFNRKRSYETGSDVHLLKSDLDFAKSNDIKQLRKIKCLRGMRHSAGLPVRGQRTKSNFRRNKGKGKKGGLGVARKKR